MQEMQCLLQRWAIEANRIHQHVQQLQTQVSILETRLVNDMKVDEVEVDAEADDKNDIDALNMQSEIINQPEQYRMVDERLVTSYIPIASSIVEKLGTRILIDYCMQCEYGIRVDSSIPIIYAKPVADNDLYKSRTFVKLHKNTVKGGWCAGVIGKFNSKRYTVFSCNNEKGDLARIHEYLVPTSLLSTPSLQELIDYATLWSFQVRLK
jgi:hypothetical protein